MKTPTISRVRIAFVLPAIFILFFFFQVSQSFCQEWHPAVELVATGDDCWYPQIAAFDNSVHVVWMDFRQLGSAQIYYKRSVDRGLNWEPGIRISIQNDVASQEPKIAVWGEHIHIVWYEGPSHYDSQVFYSRSYNGGESFSDPVQLSNHYPSCVGQEIAVFENNVHIVYHDYGTPPNIIRYLKSTDNGASWQTEKLISPPQDTASSPNLAIAGPVVYMTWNEYNYWPAPNFYYITKSVDNGDNWDPAQFFTDPGSDNSGNDLEAFGNHCYAIWEDDRDGLTQIFFKGSPDEGMNWSPDFKLSDNPYYCGFSGMAAFENEVHVIWCTPNESQVYYRFSSNHGEEWEPVLRLSDYAFDAHIPDIAASLGNAYAVWQQENGSGFDDIYFRRFIGTFSVEEEEDLDLNTPDLHQNHPNPFGGITSISFFLPDPGHILVKAYNSLGKEIAVIAEDDFPAGEHSIQWNATYLPAGIYYCQLEVITKNSEQRSDIRKMILY